MGRLMSRAFEQAGLSGLAERALAGAGLAPGDLERLRDADVLVLAGLADAVRARHRGDLVEVMTQRDLDGRRDVVVLDLPRLGAGARTGEEQLREVALLRLQTPADKAIAVSFDQTGLEFAQAALAFGADVLCGDLSTQRVLPLLDGPAQRRTELTGLCERAGRRVRFVTSTLAAAEQPS